MGSQLTPLLKIPVPDWAEKPDVPKWMLSTASESERHMVLNFDTEANRDAAIPTQNRYKGQMCYTADTDTFKYWNGQNWVRANAGKDYGGACYATFGTDVAIKTSAYYDYKMPITCTRPTGVLIFGRATFSVTAGTAWPNTNSGYLSAWLDDAKNVGAWVARWYPGYIGTQVSGDLSFITRLALGAGPHTVGMRVTAGTGSAPITVNYAQMFAIQVSPTNMPGTTGQYGDW